MRAATANQWLSNVTSIGVGYAPLSRLEQTVLAVEQFINDPAKKTTHPYLGEDVKVMGVRRSDRVELTVACAFVGSFITSIDDYFSKKQSLTTELTHAVTNAVKYSEIEITVNSADDVEKGSVYLTVTGTSAEAGDDGQAGRGNRVNGLIAPYRPMTMESVAGKNPVTHVGKLYNIVAGLIAQALVDSIVQFAAAEVYLVSRIGRPVTEPAMIDIRVASYDGQSPKRFTRKIEEIAREHLASLGRLWEDLLGGDIRIDRWPLRQRTARQTRRI